MLAGVKGCFSSECIFLQIVKDRPILGALPGKNCYYRYPARGRSDIIDDMSPLWRSTLALLAVACCAFAPGCKPKQKAQPVVVRIFRDLNSPYASELDRRILDFQASNPRLADGTLVQVGSLSTGNPQSAVNDMNDPLVEIVILNSPADAASFPALQAELPHAVNVCAAVHACPAEVPALVPSKIEGHRAEAANQFVAFLAARK